MYPTKQTKLLFKVALFQRHYKPDKSNCVECEADNTVICSKREQLSVCEHYVLTIASCEINILPQRNKSSYLEIVYNTLAI